MNLLNAIILGIVQGLTEFLPVSSSAHIRIVSTLLGTGADPGAAFTAIIQLGTETAVLIYFWRDITRIIGRWVRGLFRRVPQSDPDVRMGWFIIVGSIPIVILGLLFQKTIETTFRSLWIVAISLIVFGVILGIADRVGAKSRPLDKLTWPHAIIYGLAQSLALIPGVSRSGATIGAGLFLGYERAAAARYSFLLAVPAVFGSGIYEAYDSIKHHAHAVFSPGDTIAATIVAGVVGFGVIAFFMSYISKRSFLPFIIYRILIGAVVIILLLTNVLKPY